MSKHYVVEPEVAGGWGKNTLQAATGKGTAAKASLRVRRMAWRRTLGKYALFHSFGAIAREIGGAELTGVRFDEVEVTVSQEFMQLYPSRQLPKFVWLKVQGTPGGDDFGTAQDLRLVVSERALEVLRRVGIAHAAVTPFDEQ